MGKAKTSTTQQKKAPKKSPAVTKTNTAKNTGKKSK